MLTLQRETLYDLIDEVVPLLEMHHAELALDKDKAPLDPWWNQYAALEQADMLAIFTARADGKLVGYSAFYLQPHMHSMNVRLATNDVLFVVPEVRGSVGVRLIRYCETSLKIMGAQHISFAAKTSNQLQRILECMGYQTEQVLLGKFI